MSAISLVVVFTAALTVSPSGFEEAVASQSEIEVEVLPDGNLRDAVPTADALAQLAAISEKNMVALPAGTFDMGDWGPKVNEGGLPFDGNNDSKPLHAVTLDAFSIGKYPVTYAEFDLFTAARRLPRINQQDAVQNFRKPNNPVGVSWQGAEDYCKWLAELTGKLFDLPTEAQWEYAARSGGKLVLYPTDNGNYERGRNLPNFDQREAAGGLVAVQSFPPNPVGIYYMSAGVHEWTKDWYDPQYYQHSPSSNPRGPEQGTARVVRGHFGDGGSEMTFKRWSIVPKDKVGTWTLYDNERGTVKAQIPYAKYSQATDSAFRCVLNSSRQQMKSRATKSESKDLQASA